MCAAISPPPEITAGVRRQVQDRRRCAGPESGADEGPRADRHRAYPHLVRGDGGLSGQKAIRDSVRPDHPLAGAAACLEGRAAWLRLRHELLDGATAILDADAIIAVSRRYQRDDICAPIPRWTRPGACHLQRHRSRTSIARRRRPMRCVKYGVDPDRALCSVRRAHHAAEGRRASGGCGEVSARGDAGGAVRGRARYAGDRRRDARGSGGGARRWRRYRLDREDGRQRRGHRALLPLPRLLLPVGL